MKNTEHLFSTHIMHFCCSTVLSHKRFCQADAALFKPWWQSFRYRFLLPLIAGLNRPVSYPRLKNQKTSVLQTTNKCVDASFQAQIRNTVSNK